MSEKTPQEIARQIIESSWEETGGEWAIHPHGLESAITAALIAERERGRQDMINRLPTKTDLIKNWDLGPENTGHWIQCVDWLRKKLTQP